MNKGTAIEIVNWICNDLPHYFDNKTYMEFVAIIAELFEDPAENKRPCPSWICSNREGGAL